MSFLLSELQAIYKQLPNLCTAEQLNAALASLTTQNQALSQKVDQLMTTLISAEALLTTNVTTLQQISTTLLNGFAAIQAQNATLQAEVAAEGGPPDIAVITTAANNIQAVITQMQTAVATIPASPATPATPAAAAPAGK